MGKDYDYIDNLANNSLNNMQVTPNANWSSFETKFLNNGFTPETVNKTSQLHKILSNVSKNFITKIALFSTIVVVTVTSIVLVKNQNNEKQQSFSIAKNQNIIKNIIDLRKEKLVKLNEVSLNISLKENIIDKNTKNESIATVTQNIVDTVQVTVKQNVIVKKVVVKKETVTISDTTNLKK